MKVLKIIAWIALGALVVIQFFPTDKNESYTTPETDFVLVNKVPSEIENQLMQSCYDCHSNNTVYPWYSKIQPAAWFLEDHIKEGKAELNFNEWDNYSDRRKKSKLRSIIKQIENGEMPLDSYTLIHRDAIFSKEEKETVLNYMKTLKDDLE
ncbi:MULTISPECIES: heme-binding domain-containing protein [Flavobacteriaceae]|uniref:heme-binding domain-containing protein n=1 Tax=Flavobacteriaceae TaxID=49546 RepID=UPI00119BDCA3|nr:MULTISPECIES: heme-binding domain-containing protein [Flavobacteriaceae]MBW4971328.1 heme-binding domain-containing protein [Croceibacter atlanticus]MCD9620421.1 heme-binding domain-containing protein [Tenacibaculum maritimum]MCD9626656.1 heme-binding domain-containing protein [Tenacibaculum maritimum]MCD9629053.1 heme-binding domain-containing protein [Tenacibaculum maritimum]MCD9632466.1 heme-binding domain-containing protein [Tenacibaculum maritimum]